MLYFYYCTDHPGSKDLRLEFLSAHLQYIETNMPSIKVAGPISRKAGLAFEGSLYIIEAMSQPLADAIFEADPYFKANIWITVQRQCFQAFAGTWVGGKKW